MANSFAMPVQTGPGASRICCNIGCTAMLCNQPIFMSIAGFRELTLLLVLCYVMIHYDIVLSYAALCYILS